MSVAERDSRYEALRIFSMLLIVMHHSTYFGLGEGTFESDLFWWGGGVGVNCFVLISGYYMISSKITLKKMMRLWVQVATYAIVLCCIYLASNAEGHNITYIVKTLAKACFPVTFNQYWFVSAYVMLMLMSPFLNQYLKNASRTNCLCLCSTLFILVVINPFTNWFGMMGRFVLLYSIAATFRLYPNLIAGKIRFFSILALGTFAGIVASVWFKQCCAEHIIGGLGISTYIVKIAICRDSVASFVLSVALFVMFASFKIGRVRWVNRVAACSLGVYLLHTNGHFLEFPWKNILHVDVMRDSSWVLPYCFGATIVVYTACTLVEMLRIYTLGRFYDYIAPKWFLPIAYAIWGKARGMFESALNIR